MPHNNNSIYEFGPFRLSAAQRVLSREGEVISLAPKTMDILLVLVRRAGELVLPRELMVVGHYEGATLS
jgi:DNA-binding winged helix-turn-helix (wHTH) protein